ncbi:MAG: EAL domain-containing protein [Rubrivivax sp.]|nr:EAL domain-containing protein [Rubrivivax sp.]
MRLHYQPVIDARDGRIVGAEALVRWQHPRRGLLGPDAFIETAESTGLVRPLGRWVLQAACAQLAAWHAQGLGALQMAVNVSALQLREARFVADVRQMLDRYGLRSGALILELTESTLLDDSEGALRAVAALRQTGVQLAVDDFGTGYSSLAALKLVRPDRVKIDRGFVQGLPQGIDDATLVGAMFGMADALGIEVVAEGSRPPASATGCCSAAATCSRAGCGRARCRPRTSKRCCRRAPADRRCGAGCRIARVAARGPLVGVHPCTFPHPGCVAA